MLQKIKAWFFPKKWYEIKRIYFVKRKYMKDHYRIIFSYTPRIEACVLPETLVERRHNISYISYGNSHPAKVNELQKGDQIDIESLDSDCVYWES